MTGLNQSDILKLFAKEYRKKGLWATAQKIEDEAAVYEAMEILKGEESRDSYEK